MRGEGLERRKTEKKDGFLPGVLILSLSAVIVKIIGLVYKIPMLRLLGSEGMGYFNSAYELYTLFCTFSTAGLPVAMSVLIASSREEGRPAKVFRVAMRLFLLLGLLSGCVLFAFASPFASFLGEQKAFYCICAISPTVFLICLVSAYRGYFQGQGSMKETAISQIFEALGKLLLGLLFASIALRMGYSAEKVAAFAVLGLTLGTAISLLYLAVSRLTDGNRSAVTLERGETPKLLKALLKTAIPITLSSAVISLTKVIDMTMILRRLQDIGFDSSSAFSAYGSYTTLALPLFSLAPALIGSVALPLIPSLSRAVAADNKKDQMRVVERAIKLTVVLSLPIGLGLLLFSEPILCLIFSGEAEAIATAALPLALLGGSVTLSCLITVGNAVLQAYGRPNVPILSMVIGSLCKIALAYILIGIPSVGLIGAPISTFLCDLVINLINFAYICRCLPHALSIAKLFIRPFSASLLAVGIARIGYRLLTVQAGQSSINTLLAIASAGLLYLPLLLLCGVLTKDELCSLPILDKLTRKKQILP